MLVDVSSLVFVDVSSLGVFVMCQVLCAGRCVKSCVCRCVKSYVCVDVSSLVFVDVWGGAESGLQVPGQLPREARPTGRRLHGRTQVHRVHRGRARSCDTLWQV